MKKKRRYTILAFILLIALILFAVVELNKTNFITFFNSKGEILVIKEQEFSLSLALIGNKNNPDLKKIINSNIKNINFNNKNIEVTNFEFIKAEYDNIKDKIIVSNIDFYYLNMTLKINKNSSDNVTLSNINILTENKDYSFSIGNIYMDVLDDKVTPDIYDKLKVESNRALNFGSGLNSYSVKLINDFDNSIFLESVIIDKFKEFSPIVLINEIEFNSNSKISYEMKPNDQIEIKVLFNNNTNPSYDAYYFSPKIIFTIEDKEYTYYTSYCANGLSLDTDELRNIFYEKKQIHKNNIK